MKIKFSLCVIALLFISSSSYAIYSKGIGLYGSFNSNQSTFKVRSDSYSPPEGKLNDISAGGGLIFDSNCNSPALLNYRLKAGYNTMFMLNQKNFKTQLVEIDNILGFGLVSNSKIRIWIGPLIGVNVIWGKTASRNYSGNENAGKEYNTLASAALGYTSYQQVYTVLGGMLKDRIRSVNLTQLSGGIAAGFNFNFGEYVTVGIDGGAKWGYLFGSWRRTVYDQYLPASAITGFLLPLNVFNDKIYGQRWQFFASLSFMVHNDWSTNL